MAASSAGEAAQLRATGEVSEATLGRVVAAVPAGEREALAALVAQHNERCRAQRAPATRGVVFAALPRLCVGQPGAQLEMQLFERETLAEIVAFDLLRADPRPELPGLRMAQQNDLFEIYINEQRVALRKAADDSQLPLDAVPTDATEADLVHWLVQALRQPGLTEAELRAWTAALVGHLHAQAGLTLTSLLRARQALAQAAAQRIDDLRARARRAGFQQLVLDATPSGGWATGLAPAWQFRFQPGAYPARNPYAGRYGFGKHYFEVIHDLKDKGEEFDCAKALDALPEVKHWVRNIERQERFSFWLPTATDYFYPDFVAELSDGRLFVVEYKGKTYATNDDSRDKRAVGDAWARASAGRCVFVMVERELDGLDVAAQLRHAIAR